MIAMNFKLNLLEPKLTNVKYTKDLDKQLNLLPDDFNANNIENRVTKIYET